MTTYAFEVMSPAQAASFLASDNLVVASVLTSPAAVQVAFSGASVSLTYGGKTLTFGSAFTSQIRSLRPAGEGAIILGTPGGDAITGQTLPPVSFISLGDAIYAGAGDDTIAGGGGDDTIYGGSGADLFIARQGDGRDVIGDFEAVDRIAITPGAVTADHYQEMQFTAESQANLYAQGELRSGRADIVVAQVGADLFVYSDQTGTNTFSGQIRLQGVGLDRVSHENFVGLLGVVVIAPTPSPPPVDAPPPLTQSPPTPAAVAPLAPAASRNIRGMDGAVTGSMDQLHFASFQAVAPTEATPEIYRLNGTAATLLLGGSGFTYDSHGVLTEGQVGFVRFVNVGGPETSFLINVVSGVRTTSFGFWVANDAGQEAFATILANDDSLSGGAGSDLIRAFGGSDMIVGGGGADTLWGGTGDDIIYALNQPGVAAGASGTTYLRGEEGDDWIGGGSGFDDANGNQGNDTVTTGAGDDYCVGGKDSDLLYGGAGADFVYGNLGNDTCEGGDGNDIVRGGQDNDIVRGGAGDDFISGDKGDDTMTGGSGVDIFHTFGDAGIDRVTDFNFAEGDRVQLDPGTTYTAAQDGSDTVITMAGGGRMILVGIPLLSLSPGWIFGG